MKVLSGVELGDNFSIDLLIQQVLKRGQLRACLFSHKRG